jgi:CRISPR-associated endonuclease/helicase Cas3
MRAFAHTVDIGPWEPLPQHLQEVGDETAKRAAKFGCAAMGQILGLLHDFGKYRPAFQRYIRGEPSGGDKGHATAGAVYAKDRLGWSGRILAHAVAAHHAGLQDGLFERDGRLARNAADLIDALAGHARVKDGFVLPTKAPPPERLLTPDGSKGASQSGFQFAFLTRMLFSCLIDADRYCTERFRRRAEGTWEETPGAATTIPQLADQLAQALTADAKARAERGEADSEVNRLRQKVLAHVTAQADRPKGVFTLTVPTGGGKTLTSLSFALEHARRHNLDRVIVVIPFTSVIEQTAQVYRDKLGDLAEALLEHHSAFEESEESRKAHLRDAERQDGDPAKRRLATETWATPIVVTTAVQFFESLFAAHPTRCRKLHNLCNSVIVLDEAQTLPLKLLRPCVAALQELQRNYGASIVLCTATQPALTERPDTPERSFAGGFVNPRELAPDVPELFEALRRVRVVRAGPQTDADLRARFQAAPQALCIVNSRRHAQALFDAIRDLDGARHLSTLMTPAHRARVLATLKDDLSAGRPCRVVSTSLIEAGVDIDFPLAMRAEIGLDQLAQTAGRVNREGKRDPQASQIVVFSAPDHPPTEGMATQVQQGRAALERFPDQPFDPDAIASYFKAVYWKLQPQQLDVHGVLTHCSNAAPSLDFPFASLAQWMRLIDSPMRPVIVLDDATGDPQRAAERWTAELEKPWSEHRLGEITRKLQRHTVGAPPAAWQAMRTAGALRIIKPETFGDQFAVLTKARFYRDDIGLIWDDPSVLEAAG